MIKVFSYALEVLQNLKKIIGIRKVHFKNAKFADITNVASTSILNTQIVFKSMLIIQGKFGKLTNIDCKFKNIICVFFRIESVAKF